MLGQHSNQSPGVLFDWSHEKHLSLRDGDTPCRTTFALAHWSERVVVRLSSSLVQAYCDAAPAQRSRPLSPSQRHCPSSQPRDIIQDIPSANSSQRVLFGVSTSAILVSLN